MKKGQKLVTILVLIMIYVVLLPTCILPFFSRYYTYIINPIFWTALAILTYYFYKKVKIKNKYNYIRKAPKYKTLCNLLKNRFDLIKNLNKNELTVYIMDYKELIENLDDDKLGIIIYMENGYGFIANKKYQNNIYFNYDISDNIGIGSIVSFDEKQISNSHKKVATNVVERDKIVNIDMDNN